MKCRDDSYLFGNQFAKVKTKKRKTTSLISLFPNASQSTVAANPHLAVTLATKANQNALQVKAGGKKRSSMNKTEAEFAMILETQRRAGEITQWRFESVKLRLADDCWYIPDFFVEFPNGLPCFMEVKGGHIWDDSKVKWRIAADLHRWATFQLHQKKAGQWKQIH